MNGPIPWRRIVAVAAAAYHRKEALRQLWNQADKQSAGRVG